jgi:hypothetical protein
MDHDRLCGPLPGSREDRNGSSERIHLYGSHPSGERAMTNRIDRVLVPLLTFALVYCLTIAWAYWG